MPFIIVKRAAIFLEDTYVENPQTHELTQIITNQINVYPNQGDLPQEVPDWAETDELFDIGVSEGWIIVVGEQSARAQIEREAKKTAESKHEKVPVGLQGASTTTGWKK